MIEDFYEFIEFEAFILALKQINQGKPKFVSWHADSLVGRLTMRGLVAFGAKIKMGSLSGCHHCLHAVFHVAVGINGFSFSVFAFERHVDWVGLLIWGVVGFYTCFV